MKDIKGKKIAVLCDTLEKVKAMLKAVGKEDMLYHAEKYKGNLCQAVDETDRLCWCDKDFYEEHGYQIITFEEFMEQPKYPAEEILGWIMDNYSDTNKYDEVFGSDYCFNELVELFAPFEIIRRVSAQLDKEKLTTISKSFYDKIAKEQLDKLYPNGWKVEE